MPSVPRGIPIELERLIEQGIARGEPLETIAANLRIPERVVYMVADRMDAAVTEPDTGVADCGRPGFTSRDHSRRGEPPCDRCRSEHAAYQRRRRRESRERARQARERERLTAAGVSADIVNILTGAA